MPSVQGCWLARNVICVPLYFIQSNAAADGLAAEPEGDAAAGLGLTAAGLADAGP